MNDAPPLSPSDEKLWAMLAHLLALFSLFTAGGLGFVAPLIIYLVFKDRSAFVATEARESLNFQLTVLIVSLVGVAATFVTCGLGAVVVVPVAVVAGIVALIWMIMAAVKSYGGLAYRYPLCLRLVK